MKTALISVTLAALVYFVIAADKRDALWVLALLLFAGGFICLVLALLP